MHTHTDLSIFNDGWVTVGFITATNPLIGLPSLWAEIDCKDRLSQVCNGEQTFTFSGGDEDDVTVVSGSNPAKSMHVDVKRLSDRADDVEWRVKLFSVPIA